jgi:hypothetical protein
MEVEAGGGYLWEPGGALALYLRVGLAYSPGTFAPRGYGGELTLAGGGGARLTVSRWLWLGLEAMAGASLLWGATTGSFLFEDAYSVSGIFARFALRPALRLGIALGEHLSLLVCPFALSYGPPHSAFSDNIERSIGFHAGVGVAWRP